MLAFSGCTHDLSPEQAEELKTIRWTYLIKLCMMTNIWHWLITSFDFQFQREHDLVENKRYWSFRTESQRVLSSNSKGGRVVPKCSWFPIEYPYIYCFWRNIWGWISYEWSADSISYINEQGMDQYCITHINFIDILIRKLVNQLLVSLVICSITWAYMGLVCKGYHLMTLFNMEMMS